MDKLSNDRHSNTEDSNAPLDFNYRALFWISTSVLAVPVLLVVCGVRQLEVEFKQEAMAVSETSEFHEIAIESYLKCSGSLFQSNQSCIVTSVQLAQQSGLKDTAELARDMRELADSPAPSTFDVMSAGYRFVNPF